MSYIAFMLYAVQGEKETMSTIPGNIFTLETTLFHG